MFDTASGQLRLVAEPIKSTLASVDGAIGPAEQAMIPVSDEGLLRGDGAFEVMRLYSGTPFALDEHFVRLGRSCAGLRLEADLDTLRAEATLALANLLFLLCLVLGGIVLPLDRLPDAVAAVAGVLPPAALTQALAIGLGATFADATGPMLLLAGWALVFAILAARRFRWD